MQQIVRSVQWLRTTQELRVFIDVRGETDLQHPVTSRIVVSKREYVGGCVMWDNPNTGAYMDHDMVGHPDTFETKVLASRHPTGFTAAQEPTNRNFKGFVTFRVDDLPTGDYFFDYAKSKGSSCKRVKLFTIHGSDTGRGLDVFFGRDGEEKLNSSYSPSPIDGGNP